MHMGLFDSARPACRFKPYDADIFAPARYFMPARDAPDSLNNKTSVLLAQAARTGTRNTFGGGKSGRRILEAGAAGELTEHGFSLGSVATSLRSLLSDNSTEGLGGSDIGSGSSNETEAVAAALAAASQNASTALPEAGDPYRWRLPPVKENEMTDLANMMADVRHMHNVFIIYTSLQSVLLVMLIARLAHHMSFHPRVGVITKTLVKVRTCIHLLSLP